MVENNNGFVNKLQQRHTNISVLYNEHLKEHVCDLSIGDVKLRIVSFMLDSIFMFWPSIIFIISLLLLTSPANIGGEIIRNTSELSIIYVISILCFNTISSLYYYGQTIGMRYYDLKVVCDDNRELSKTQIVVRELFGKSIPWILILLTFSMRGFTTFILAFFAFIILNFFIILGNKKHRSLIDILMHTKIVKLPSFDEIECMEQADIDYNKDSDVIIKETSKEEETPNIEAPIAVEEEETPNIEAPIVVEEEETPKIEAPIAIEEEETLIIEEPVIVVEEATPIIEEPTGVEVNKIPIIEESIDEKYVNKIEKKDDILNYKGTFANEKPHDSFIGNVVSKSDVVPMIEKDNILSDKVKETVKDFKQVNTTNKEVKNVFKPKPTVVPKNPMIKEFKEVVQPIIETKQVDKPKEKISVLDTEIVKEKSVSEIISEAVSVVDQALEIRRKDYLVNIEKPHKASKDESGNKKLEEPNIETLVDQGSEVANQNKKNGHKKNVKKKYEKSIKGKAIKKELNVKKIKTQSSLHKAENKN